MNWTKHKSSLPQILLVTRNFPPLIGGMERLIHHIYLELSRTFKLGIVGPSGCENYLDADTLVSTCPPTPPSRFLLSCHWRTHRMIRQFRADLVFAGSGLTAPAALLAGLQHRMPVVCYLHGLDLIANNRIYQAVFLPAIRACDALIVNSHHTKKLAETAGIEPSRIRILHPGVQIPPCHPGADAEAFRRRIGAGSGPILLSVGRLTKRKGILEFVEHCLPEIVHRCPSVLFVLIGGEARQAVRKSVGMIQLILEAALSKGIDKHLLVMGNVDDETLYQAYAASQLLIFPVIEQPDDVEGFGMVALEAAAYGLPTVAFATGGVTDAIRDRVSGYLVNPGNYAEFAETVLRCLQDSPDGISGESCIAFANNFSWERFGKGLRKICTDLISTDVGGDRIRRTIL